MNEARRRRRFAVLNSYILCAAQVLFGSCSRSNGLSREGFARYPGKEAACDNQICNVDQTLQNSGCFCITQKCMQDIANGAGLGKNVRSVPERRCAKGNPAQLLHTLNSIAKQPGGEEDQEYTHHTEEDAEVESIAQAIDQHT